MGEPFKVIVADPPWSAKDHLPGKARGAAKHYPCMSVEAICSFPLPPMASTSVLLLWRVAWAVPEACQVAKAWGYTPMSEMVWIKTTKTGKPRMLMGRHVRLQHEVCMICTRGVASRLVKNHSTRSTFLAALGAHSEKPTVFYDLVESLYPGPYVELFARRSRPGWVQFGNELPGGEAHP